MNRINIPLFICTLIFATGCADLGENPSSPNVVTEVRKIKVEEISKEVKFPGFTISHKGEVLSTSLSRVETRTEYKHSYEFKIDDILHQTTIVLDEKNESDINVDDYINIIVRLNANDRINVSSMADYVKEKYSRFDANSAENGYRDIDSSVIRLKFYDELTRKTLFEKPCYIDTEFNFRHAGEDYIDHTIVIRKKGLAFSKEGCYFLDIRLKDNGWIDILEVNSPYRYESSGSWLRDLIRSFLYALFAGGAVGACFFIWILFTHRKDITR